MIRRPPRSTPFPYTTLSRSQEHARREAEQETRASHNQLQKLIDNTAAVVYMKRIDNGRYLLVNQEWERLFGVDQDRKSTRLNSSHSQISYAVFCLKKKTRSH